MSRGQYDGGMSEILLARHAKSYANLRDVAFGNVESPLTDEGLEQAAGLNHVFREQYGIDPESYGQAVAVSELLRTQQTARGAGFQILKTEPVINETEIPPELLGGRMVIEKHVKENWIPSELRERAQRFLELVRRGELGYQIYFTHGFFIASVVAEISDEYAARQQESPYLFKAGRGYIPRLATITPASL